jgi:hypothetical protein
LNTHCVGTVRLNRKDVPEIVKEKKLKKGELIAQHSGQLSVLKWSDKKEVTMIFNLSREGKKNRANKTWPGKGKTRICARLQRKREELI